MYIYTAKIQKELMITTIFSKSKPINYIIVFSIMLIAYLVLGFKFNFFSNNSNGLVEHIFAFLGAFFSVLILNFIVLKNGLSQQNNYEILVVALFFLALPQSFLSIKIIASNLFILLALRRIISVRSKKDLIKKVFDAGFLIGLSAVFYFWSILFFPLIIIALLFFSETKFQLYIIPFLGLLCVAIILVALSVILHEDFTSLLPQNFSVNFNYTAYNSFQFIGAITLLLSFGLWSSLFYLADIKKKMRSYRPSYKIMFAACILASCIVVIAPNKNGSEFLFLFSPLAVIFMNYIETIKEKWFKETFLALIVVVPILLLML